MNYEPYRAPDQPRDALPGVIVWFRVYAALMALASFGTSAGCIYFASASKQEVPLAVPVVIVVLAFAVFFAVAACIPRRPWGWTLGLAAIAISLTGCTIVVGIPLLLHWMKPTTKAAFARL